MKILITGASGFIGKHLYKEFSKDHEVVGIENASGDTPGYLKIDLSRPDNIESNPDILKLNKLDAVVHCASILANEQNHRDINLLYNNLKITESVVKIVGMFKPSKVVNFSTIGVYPNIDGCYNEKSEINPSQNYEGLYGLSKYCSEELFKYFVDEAQTNVINLRLAQTIGPGMRGDRIHSVMLNELKQTNTISVWGNGERVNSFMSIDFLCRKLCLLLDKDGVEGVYNIGEKNMSYLELANDIIKHYGDAKSKAILLDKGQSSKVYIDTTKINGVLK